MNKYLKYYLIGILLLFFLMNRQCSKIEELNDILQVSQDTLRVEKLKNGRLLASTKVYEITNIKQLKKLAAVDAESKRLVELVKQLDGKNKKLEAALATSSYTVIKDTAYLDSIIYRDSCMEYYGIIRTEWLQGTIYADCHAIFPNLISVDSTDIGFYRERKNMFSPWELRVGIVQYNPNTTTAGTRAFTIAEKSHRISLGIQFGYGLTIHGFTPYIGGGLQYRLK